MYWLTDSLARLDLGGKGRAGRVLRWWAMCLLAFFLTGYLLALWERAIPFGLTYVATESIPTGIYFSRRYDGSPLSAEAAACFERPYVAWAQGRPYARDDLPLCKLVLGVPGDKVIQRHRDVLICRPNGSCISAGEVLDTDSQGQPLKRWAPAGQEYVLGPGQYWMGGPHPRSFDSRYLGPISSPLLIKRITPLWTKPLT